MNTLKIHQSILHNLNNIFAHIRQLIINCMPPVLAICGFFLLCGIVLILRGQNAFEFYKIIFLSGFSNFDEFGSVLFNATPLIFTGLSVAIGYKAGLFNIGCEGQLYVAAFAAAWVGINFNLPSVLMIPLCLCAALLAGAIWGGIPGILKAKFGAHEVINTIMMNFIALAITNLLVTSVYREPGQMIPHTSPISKSAHLPRLADALFFIPDSNLLNASFIIASISVILCYVLLKYTRWGYELRLVGNAPDVAEYGGINPRVVTVWVMALSGAIAGLAGVADVMGYRYRFADSFSSGWGFTGIAVALLGKNHPFGVFAAALLFGLLNKVALDIELFLNVPRGLFLVGQGLLIIWLVCQEGLTKRKT